MCQKQQAKTASPTRVVEQFGVESEGRFRRGAWAILAANGSDQAIAGAVLGMSAKQFALLLRPDLTLSVDNAIKIAAALGVDPRRIADGSWGEERTRQQVAEAHARASQRAA